MGSVVTHAVGLESWRDIRAVMGEMRGIRAGKIFLGEREGKAAWQRKIWRFC